MVPLYVVLGQFAPVGEQAQEVFFLDADRLNDSQHLKKQLKEEERA
jgi:hypothetical protein